MSDQETANIFNAMSADHFRDARSDYDHEKGLVSDSVRNALSDVVMSDITAANAKVIAADALVERAIDLGEKSDKGVVRINAGDLFKQFTGLASASTKKLDDQERSVYNSVAYIVRLANEKLVRLEKLDAKTKAERDIMGLTVEVEQENPADDNGWTNEKLADYIIQQCGNDHERVKAVFGAAMNKLHHA